MPLVALAAEPDEIGLVTLEVGVHRDAGGILDVAADGTAGQCVVQAARISCPAHGAVTFRWGRSDGWALVGDTVLQPGEVGEAFVLRPEHERLLQGWLDTAANDDDPLARRDAVEALWPWLFHASWGPLPSTAPVPVPPGWLQLTAKDPDWRVRIALIQVARDFRDPRRAQEVEDVIWQLTHDRDKHVRRAALIALGHAARADLVGPEIAWARALESVAERGAPGRAACGTLARLVTELEPNETIDPAAAVERVLSFHPEQAWRVWGAWRHHVPYRTAWADQLLRTTNGLHKGLLLHWAETEPAQLAAAIRAWEPTEPHTERFRALQLMLDTAQDPALRAALALP